LSTISLVRREPETVRAFFAEKDSVCVLFECSRLVTARKMLETVGHRASLPGRCHWHMVKRERCIALSAASYSAFHCRTLSFEAAQHELFTVASRILVELGFRSKQRITSQGELCLHRRIVIAAAIAIRILLIHLSVWENPPNPALSQESANYLALSTKSATASPPQWTDSASGRANRAAGPFRPPVFRVVARASPPPSDSTLRHDRDYAAQICSRLRLLPVGFDCGMMR